MEFGASWFDSPRHLQHAGTCEVQREMHQRPAHHQFDNIFKSRKIKEEEVTLELILANFSGKKAFVLNLIVLS